MTKTTIADSPRARRARAKVVGTSEAGVIQRITWAQPVTFNPHALPRSRRSLRETDAAEQFLHGAICTHADRRRVNEILAIFPRDKVREGRVHFGRLKSGQAWEPHASAECDGPRWAFLEKRRSELPCLRRPDWGARFVRVPYRRCRAGERIRPSLAARPASVQARLVRSGDRL
jgi:hypothetical protein